MKSTWYIALLLLLITSAACEDNPLVINMNCALVGDGYDLYLNDAEQLTLRHIINEQLPEQDSIELPQDHIERIHKALIAVYNATDTLPSAKKVVEVYQIHTFPSPTTNRLIMGIDSSYAWVQEWIAGNTLTGNPDVDDLINTYNLTLNHVGIFGNWASLLTDNSLNTVALGNAFEAIDGVLYASPEGVFGDGNDIEMLNYSVDEITLTYSFGWGDCLAGCIYRHYWEFTIDENCEVVFEGEYGTPLLQ